MKQKTNNKTPVTKEEVTDILKDYPTKKEVDEAFKNSEKQIRQAFDKKLADRLIKNENAFRTEIQHEFSVMNEKWEQRFSKFTNLILTAIDPLIQDMKIRQQEREIAAGQVAEIRIDVNDHEKRIHKLEHS